MTSQLLKLAAVITLVLSLGACAEAGLGAAEWTFDPAQPKPDATTQVFDAHGSHEWPLLDSSLCD